jgi:methenyltetrahydrofolate cyclohydrolase
VRWQPIRRVCRPAASGITAALAAGLAAMAGRFALRHDLDSAVAADLITRADSLRTRAVALADADADGYGRYVAATRLPRDPDPEQRRAAIRAALDAAAARRAMSAGQP